MANPTVTAQFGAPSASAAPLTFTELVTELNALSLPVSIGQYTPYVVSSSTPAVNDQDKIWLKILPSGQPGSFNFFYNGDWRRVYNGMIGEVRCYNGDPSVDFDSSGLGIVGGEYDGWALMNGQNGTNNATDFFIVAAHMDNAGGISGYQSGWISNVDQSVAFTGGQATVTLDATNTWHASAHGPILVDRWSADGNVRNSSGQLYGLDGTHDNIEIVPADTVNEAPVPIPTVPPWFALAYITFVGYT